VIDLYFRIRETGALVFRPEEDARTRRLELRLVARVNLGKELVRPQPGVTLSDAETARIEAWIAARRAILAARGAERALRLVEEMNAVADWLAATATPGEAEAAAAPLLMAMHDLRATILRRKEDAAEETP
jgi:hypothetical protein